MIKSSKSDSPSLGLSIIVKDASATLRRSLESCSNLVKEIVAVDTGSSDNTLEILHEFGAKIIQTKWNDDFSEPRNIALENSSADWVISLDSDEWFTEDDAEEIKKNAESDKADAWVLGTINYVSHKNKSAFSTRGLDCNIAPAFLLSSKIRLFKRGKVKWEGKVHELVDFSALKAGYRIERSKAMVRHTGLLKKNPSDYYLSLSYKSYESGEAHPGIMTIIAAEELKRGRHDKAESILRQAISAEPKFSPPYPCLASLLYQTNRSDQAVQLLLDALKTTLAAPEVLSCLIQLYELRNEKSNAQTMLKLGKKLYSFF